MSVMRTVPVFKCRVCGEPVAVRLLETYRADPDGTLLMELMRGLEKVALCRFHQAQRDWYANQDRLAEWESTARWVAPLLVVRDPRKDPEWPGNG